MKWVVRIIVLLVVLIGGGIGSSYWWLDGAARKLIEQEGSDALGVTLELKKLSIGVLKGTATLGELKIANPPGCQKPLFFDLNEGHTEINIRTVMEDEIHIPTLELSGLTVYLEPVKGGGGKYNYDVLLANIDKYTTSEEIKSEEGGDKTIVIKKLLIKDIKVYYKTTAFITAPVHIEVIEMDDVGSDGRGVDMGELISIIISGTLKGIANDLPAVLGDGIKAGVGKIGDIGGVAVDELSKATTSGLKKATDELDKLNPFKKK